LGSAGRLYDWVAREFGSGDVFMDVDTIHPGADFTAALSAALAACDVLLAVIGKDWLVTEAIGARRLDQSDDFARQEIEEAKRRRKTGADGMVLGAWILAQTGTIGVDGAISRATAGGIRTDSKMLGTRSSRWILASAMSGLEFETMVTHSFLLVSISPCSSSPASWKYGMPCSEACRMNCSRPKPSSSAALPQ
jgi:hypothetical protein